MLERRTPIAIAAGGETVSKTVLYAQLFGALAILLSIGLMPPNSGAILVVPVTGQAVKPWLDRRDDIHFVGPGRLSGSLVVFGTRDALLGDALAHGAILLPAFPVLCSNSAAESRLS